METRREMEAALRQIELAGGGLCVRTFSPQSPGNLSPYIRGSYVERAIPFYVIKHIYVVWRVVTHPQVSASSTDIQQIMD